MTEQEWLTSPYPQAMLEFLRASGIASDRKLRLFACACCHRVWSLLTDERSRQAIQDTEDFVDGRAGPALDPGWQAARRRALVPRLAVPHRNPGRARHRRARPVNTSGRNSGCT